MDQKNTIEKEQKKMIKVIWSSRASKIKKKEKEGGSQDYTARERVEGGKKKKKRKGNRGARRGKGGVGRNYSSRMAGPSKRHRPGVELKVNVGGVPMYV